MARQNLGELEQVLLLALLRLGGDAYGAAIRAEVLERTGRSVTPGAIYPTLDRLEARGLLRSRLGEPVPERGGRARRHFAVTPGGLREIREAWRQTSALASGLAVLKTGGRDA
jgi:DNA-binding PadR family transcriptional regulator